MSGENSIPVDPAEAIPVQPPQRIDPIEVVRQSTAVLGRDRAVYIAAAQVAQGKLTPVDAFFALHSTGNDATLGQPAQPQYRGVPMQWGVS